MPESPIINSDHLIFLEKHYSCLLCGLIAMGLLDWLLVMGLEGFTPLVFFFFSFFTSIFCLCFFLLSGGPLSSILVIFLYFFLF